MKVAVISSCYGGYDEPAPPVPQDIDCEFVLIADKDYDCPPWRTIVEPRPQLHPRLAAKVAKCQPYRYADAYAYIWVDASILINSSEFVSWAVAHLEHGPLAMHPHPNRTKILDEANASRTLQKYAGLPVVEQADYYIRRGFPDGWGLWACGVMARKRIIPHEFGERWLAEQVRWTYQDQISLPPILQSFNIRPVPMEGDILRHNRFGLRSHKDGS